MLTEFGDCQVAPWRQPLLHERLLYAGLSAGDFTHASEDKANNKLDLGADELAKYAQIFNDAVYALDKIVMDYEPDLLVGTPTGADGYVGRIANARNVDYLYLAKQQGRPAYVNGGADRVRKYGRLVVVEDVLNSLTTTRRVLELPGIAERTVAVVGLWDRGDMRRRKRIRKFNKFPRHIPVNAVIRQYIPPMLPATNPIWEYAREDRRI